MARRKFTSERSCSFCGKGEEDVERLIAGPAVFICDECVAICNGILAEHPSPLEPATAG
jgi:ATP-dependent Clp protease ATP-binding subunit ClpX